MKKSTILIAALACIATLTTLFAFKSEDPKPKKEYLQITAIESVVPGGLGRSRIISTDETGSNLEEIKLENFYSMVGINFGNVRNNDLVMTKKITDLTDKGWELEHVTCGVESGAEKTGLFITRYLFVRDKK